MRTRPVGSITRPRRRSTKATSAGEPGLRERNRLDKRQRIREATRELFSTHGFEAATLRQIAGRAQVGLGTLFNYARDKRDLTFLLFNEDLSSLADEAIAASALETRLVGQLLALWEPHYRYFARDPVLSRILLRSMYFYWDGDQALEFHRTEARLREHILRAVESAQQDGRVTNSAPAEDIASLLFFVSECSVRYWIDQPEPLADQGLSTLRSLLELQVRAFEPDAAVRRPRPPRRAKTRG